MKKTLLLFGLAVLCAAGLVLWWPHRSSPQRVAPAASAHEGAQAILPSQVSPAAAPAAATTAALVPLTTNELAVVVGGTGAPFTVRQAALRSLRPPLTAEQVTAVYGFLRSQTPHPGTLPGGEHVLKNDLMALLTRQEPPPEGLLQELAFLSRDFAQDAVVRDYALQHLAQCAAQPTNRFGAGLDSARAALWEAVNDTSGTLAGTALLGLHRQAAFDPAFDAARLDTTAITIARDAKASPLSRTTALQVCALRGLSMALPDMVELAQTGATLPLRAAAVAALGDLGTPGEAALLAQFQSDTNTILRQAATAALKRMQARPDLSKRTTPSLPTRAF